MAYIDGYTYDIFISYSHLDNQKTLHEEHGWIEEFYDELTIALTRRIGEGGAIKFWWDVNRLAGNTVFDKAIEEAIQQSAIMICLNSPGYLKSLYCRKELNFFYTKAQKEARGLNINNNSRILNVLINNVSYTTWPYELAGTSGFQFNDARKTDDFGDTLKIKSDEFDAALKALREAIFQLTVAFKAPLEPAKFTIFFGDVAERLDSIKERTITELQGQKYNLVSGIPPPNEYMAHENAVREKLKTAKLAIHLMDKYPGKEIKGKENTWYPQRQAEISLESQAPQLIWTSSDMNIDAIEEEPYKLFLKRLETGAGTSAKTKYVRGVRSELTQQIINLSNQILSEAKTPSPGKIAVLLDTHYEDQLYALELDKMLVENGIQPFLNPEDDDPKQNEILLNDRISRVSKLVFFYGKVSYDWVKERMNAAFKLIVSNKYPTKAFFILMMPPHKNPDDLPPFSPPFLPVNIINHSDAPQLDINILQPFLKSITQ